MRFKMNENYYILNPLGGQEPLIDNLPFLGLFP